MGATSSMLNVLSKRCRHLVPGADPGEVKWVNFQPPFSEPPSFFFLFLKHLNQALVLLHYYKIHPPPPPNFKILDPPLKVL